MYHVHSVNNTNITNNQSEHNNSFNCQTQSATSTIFKMAATDKNLTVAEQEIFTAWQLAEAVWCYPILRDKSMKEFKNQKQGCPVRKILGKLSGSGASPLKLVARKKNGFNKLNPQLFFSNCNYMYKPCNLLLIFHPNYM